MESLDQFFQDILDNGLTPSQKTNLDLIKAKREGKMRESIVVLYVPIVANFMADSSGRVNFDGKGQWSAQDGGAYIKIGSLSPEEAKAIDYGARSHAYPDA